MRCPFCANTESQVLESRSAEDTKSIRRRRQCEKCKKRYTTYEQVRKSSLWVIKKDGRREPFDKEKMKRGLLRAIEKRPISVELVDDIINRVEREMLRKEKEEVSTKMIGSSVLRKIKAIDKVAWLRFASVYMEFDGVDDFIKIVKK